MPHVSFKLPPVILRGGRESGGVEGFYALLWFGFGVPECGVKI